MRNPARACRAQSLRPKLSDEQRQQLEQCFELMDADGSGAIDADEMGAAFKVSSELVAQPEWAALAACLPCLPAGAGSCTLETRQHAHAHLLKRHPHAHVHTHTTACLA